MKQEYNITHVISLISASEQPGDVRLQCAKFEINWRWVEMKGANEAFIHVKKFANKVKRGVRYARKQLESGAKMLLHCAAGIHRTGLFAYTLLRYCGFNLD
jgi:protein-tyrosine phosphatase